MGKEYVRYPRDRQKCIGYAKLEWMKVNDWYWLVTVVVYEYVVAIQATLIDQGDSVWVELRGCILDVEVRTLLHYMNVCYGERECGVKLYVTLLCVGQTTVKVKLYSWKSFHTDFVTGIVL